MNRLLVTGGAGFIGSNFIHYMLAQYPAASDREPRRADLRGQSGQSARRRTRSALHASSRATSAIPRTWRRRWQGCDAVVNFAAETHVDRSIHEGGAFVETDVRGVFVLCEEARKQKVQRFLHISTDEVYGSIDIGALLGRSIRSARPRPTAPPRPAANFWRAPIL